MAGCSCISGNIGLTRKIKYLFLCLVYVTGTHADVEFVLSRNNGNWDAASESCKSIRGTLAILDNIELQRSFDRDIQPNPGEPIWVGRYLGYSRIVTIHGCYRNQTFETKRSKVLVNNYLVTCLKECQDTLYIGMQGQLCYCADSVPMGGSVPGIFCQSECPGENSGTPTPKVSWCGRPEANYNTVSVYRRVLPNEIRVDTNSPNFGECIAYNTQRTVWQPTDCNLLKRFTCDRDLCNGPPAVCVLESSVTGTWWQARDQCVGSNSRLATVNLTSNVYFSNRQIVGDPLYWTALHRKEAHVWSYDSQPTDIERSDRCYAAVKQQNGMWQLVQDWCNNEHRYACVQDKKTTPAPNTPTPSVTTPRPVTPAPSSPTTSRVTTPRTVATPSFSTVNPDSKPVVVTPGSAGSSSGISIVCMLACVMLTLVHMKMFLYKLFA